MKLLNYYRSNNLDFLCGLDITVLMMNSYSFLIDFKLVYNYYITSYKL